MPPFWAALEKLPISPKALRQGRRAGGVLLQQIKASLDHFVLAETKGLAEAL
jgi:hypothetical protein